MKTKLDINLDKLDVEYLEELKVRTGKDDENLIKLAIQALHEKLCASQPQAPQMPSPHLPYEWTFTTCSDGTSYSSYNSNTITKVQ